MYHHLLVFTDDDRTRLKAGYYTLMQKLESGKEIEKQSIDELTETMRVMLQSQKDLQPFWQQVDKSPEKHFHLHLSHTDKDLLNLPWQLAIDTKRYPFIHISKGSPAITTFTEYRPQPGPLKILVMISSPRDLEYDKRLSYEEEEQAILTALSSLWMNGQVQVHFTDDGSLANLQAKLRLQHYHILYFSGHGIYKNTTGYLQLENPVTFEIEEVKAQQLAQVLKEVPSNLPPLIILSSCQTAQGSIEDGFRGVADELIHQGVPAVIAMAYNIKDQFNILFAGHLYEHLANKHLLTEAWSKALQDMRSQEQLQLDSSNQKQYRPSQWLIPQLYLGQQVNHIVDWGKTEANSNNTVQKGGDFRFIGRRRECSLLVSELAKCNPVSITGQAGIGKTALAEYARKRLTLQDASYYSFAFTENNIGLRPMIAQLLQYLETADPAYDKSYEADNWDNIVQCLDFLIKKVTRFCKPVWQFDNLENCQEHADGVLKEEYHEWINYVQGHLFNRYPVILISRYAISEAKHIFTISLHQAPFVDFYRKCLLLELKNLHTKINLPEPVNVASLLYTMFGGSYRTLEFLNEEYVQNPAKTEELIQQITRLEHARAAAKQLMGNVHSRMENFDKRMVLQEIMTLLTNDELKTFHLLIHFDRPVLPLALELQQPGKKFDVDLQRLKNFTLIEERLHTETGRKLYFIPPLIKNSIEGVSLPQVYFMPEKAGDYFFEAMDQITVYLDDLEEAFEFYSKCGSIPKVNRAGIQLTNRYIKVGRHEKSLHFGMAAEEIAGDKTDGDIFNNMGLAYLKFGMTKQALTYFTRFSIASRIEKDDKKLANAFNAIGQTYVQLEDYDTAMEWLEKSNRLATKNKFQTEEALTLSNIGMVYCELGELDKALKAFQRCLRIRKEINDLKGQANLLNNLARIYGERGDHQKQKEILQEAFSIAVEIGNKNLQGGLLNNIGSILLEEGRNNEALICFQKNLAISESIDDEEEVGKAHLGLGMAYQNLGKHNEAVDHFSKASLLLQRFDYPGIHSETLINLAKIYIERGDAADALPFLNTALADFRRDKKPGDEALALYHMGDAYLYLDDIDNATKHLEGCLHILKRVDDNETEMMALIRVGQCYAIKGESDKVLDTQERILVIARSTGDRVREGLALHNIALAYQEKGMHEMFLFYTLEAYNIPAETNDLDNLYYLSTILGAFLCSHMPDKYLQEGIWFLEQAYEIGLQSSEFPGLELVQSMIEQFQQLNNKKNG